MQTAGQFPPSAHSIPITRSTHSYLPAILLAAVISRLLVLWLVLARFPHAWLYSRGIELGTLAASIVAGNGLSSPFGGSTGPTALLGPGYPAVIALVFRIFGSFSFAAAVAIMLMQFLFSVVTVLVIFTVARELFGVLAANLAGLLWGLSLPLLWMPTIFWETCLSTLLLVGMIALALRCKRKPRVVLWGLMGAYCGVAVLVNPALLLALLAILGWTAWHTRKLLRYTLLLAPLVLLLVVAPWPIRNARVLHAFIPLRSTVGFELWVGNRIGATGFLEESQFPLFNTWEYDNYVSHGEVEYMRNKTALAEAYIRSHPCEFLRLSAVRCLRFWTGTGNRDGSWLFALHASLTTSLGFLGLWRLITTSRRDVAILFLLPIVLFPLPYYITHAEFRYRLVIDPLLTILAGYAVSEAVALFAEPKVRSGTEGHSFA
jgi:4-amino-4-deoxy-L-arabinose transferase-like glycosyltransferase